jgi:predicted GNAT family acetyltransferase
MNLIDAADLPKSAADGPESWGEAWTKLASTTSTAQQMIENTTSDRSMLEDIYARRIKTIADLTGQTLENPIRSDIGVPGFLQPPFRAAYTKNEEEFSKRVSTLAQQYPELSNQFQSLSGGVDDEMNRMRREAQQASGAAALNPNLDPISRFGAQMAGGLAGAARDPFQWQMAIAGGGGGSAGGSVAGRIGKTMVSEFMLNGGQEAVLQAASQPRKKAAGLEYGLGDALANIGVAGTFGALFGGTLEAGHALAGLYRMGDGGAEIAARVLDGKPQPGDVETMAKAMGVELQPEQLQQLNRSFEERVLDDHMIGPDATPDQQRVFESALRYAEDPDNHPPPDVVERAIADEQAGPARTLTADDYERIYGGDPNAIDDLRGVMQAESLDDAARLIDDQTRVPSAQTVEPNSEAFRNWFGQSRVVDQAGKPVVVYRGEERFNDDVGLWFTSDSDTASAYSERLAGGYGDGANVTPAYLSIRNPLEVDARGGRYDELKFDGATIGTEDLLRIAKEQGRDGIIVRNVRDGSVRPVDVFRPVSDLQVKSVFDRTFSSKTGFGERGFRREARSETATGRSTTATDPIAPVVEVNGDKVTIKSQSGDAHLSLRADGENLKVGVTTVSKASRGKGKARELYEEAVRLADENGGVLRSDISVSNDALRVYNSLSRRGYDVRRNPDAVRTEKGWIAPDQPGQNWVFEVRPRPDPNAVVDPLEGQAIRPRLAAEPTDAEAMRIAEEQAGAIGEPVIDANGNPQSLFDYIPITDRDGNVRLVSPSEALEIADQGNILADLLEVCQV